MRRTLPLFLTSLLLWALMAELNHLLTGVRVQLFVGTLFFVFAALTQPLVAGLVATFLAGLICDASQPLWFQPHLTPAWSLKESALFGLAHANTLLFAVGHVVLFSLRERLPRHDPTGRIVIALLANLAVFLLFSFLHLTRSPALPSVWLRLVIDLVASQLFLMLAAPWFFALQSRTLAFAQLVRGNLA